MDRVIAEFTALLRANGLRVSMTEHVDAFRAAAVLGLGDREVLKHALRASMVKRSADLDTYEELFDLYFGGVGRAVGAAAEGAMAELRLDAPGFQDLLDRLENVLREIGVELSELAEALLRNDTGRIEKLLREAAERAGVHGIERAYQEGRFSHAVAEQIGFGALADELAGVKGRLATAGLPPGLAGRLEALLDQRLRDLREMIRRAVRVELEQRDPTQRERPPQLAALSAKSFYYLSEDEVRRMRDAVAHLARRLKNAVAIRRRRGKRGKLDVSATLRANLQCGGVPFRIRFERRRREKPQVLVLCDVSDSVRNVSRFMLQFVYSLQDLYSRVRSFIFVSDIGETTQLFEEHDTQRALELAMSGAVINVFAHSDFGRAFRAFHRDYLGAVTRRTTVIVLGDARNNYNAPHEWVLREVQARAKQLIWLNPESRLTWGFGDSEMDRYLPFCDLAEECRNLNQLYGVVDRLVR